MVMKITSGGKSVIGCILHVLILILPATSCKCSFGGRKRATSCLECFT